MQWFILCSNPPKLIKIIKKIIDQFILNQVVSLL